MAQALPIRFQQLLDLTSVGIQQSSIAFATLTVQSDRFICIREQTGASGAAVVIVDMENPATPTKHPITADSAIMHPSRNILALKAQQTLQIFDLKERKKVKGQQMREQVVFWKWIDTETVALVTTNSVYHWALDATSEPKKVFDRLAQLRDHQIINYHVNHDKKWMCLVGITQKEGRIAGNIQLYSLERKISQPLEGGHAAAFTTFNLNGKKVSLFCFATRSPAQSKLYITELGSPTTFQKKTQNILFPQDSPGDFPVSMQVSEKYGVIYMITKFGFLHIFDIEHGKLIYMRRISEQTIFVTVPYTRNEGIMGVSRTGQVLSVTLDENNIIRYILSTLNDTSLARSIAARANLPGADNLFIQEFNQRLQAKDWGGAAKVAAKSPGTLIRNANTIKTFQSLPAVPGQHSPLLQYFGTLLEHGKLNKIESLELARPVLQQGRKDLLEKWLKEDKLECSEELGDIARAVDIRMALSIYYRAEIKEKVVQIFAETGQFPKLVVYAKSKDYTPNWMQLLQAVISSNPQAAVNFAKMLCTAEGGALVDADAVADAFMSRGMIQECTSFLLDILSQNKPEEGALQTKLLSINLNHRPQGVAVADAILGNEMFTHFDHKAIAKLCESAGLFQRALEQYDELNDVKRVLRNAHSINADFLIVFFGQLTSQSADDSYDCLQEMLSNNLRQNLQTVVKIGAKYAEQIGEERLIKLFEEFQSWDGVFYFCQAIVNTSENPEVVFKYIEAAARFNPPQVKEIERVVRESKHYDPERVKDFLKEVRLPDQLPLVIVCDTYNFIEDLTRYLYDNGMEKYIEAYVKSINPVNTPLVVGALIDVDCNEDYIKTLVDAVGNLCPVDKLVEAVEKRNRLKILQPWLEARVTEGSREPALHNAIAKIYIAQHNNPEEFLTQNQFYDSRVVGKYCENRDPHLAFVAYKRGLCDYELVEVTNKHASFKDQARYLVERQDAQLWAYVLKEDNENRSQVVNQVVQTALPESDNPEQVSTTVKAFMVAKLPNELIELLEKIVLENSQFSNNRNLQNLLILTAIKANKRERVLEYINRLDNYDGRDIANIAINAQFYEEAFTIFKNFKHNTSAVQVLVEHIGNLERASEFAETIGENDVWSKLAKAQLDQGKVAEAIESYRRAQDHEFYQEVVAKAKEQDLFKELIPFLKMCRTKVREPRIESELVFAYAKTEQLAEMEEFITGPNCAQIQKVGDVCFAEGMYEAAKRLYNNINNFGRMAATLVKLGDFQQAVAAAQKANNIISWKEVNKACVDAEKFRLAGVCALHIIVHGDELQELIRYYEHRGHFDQLLKVMEDGVNLKNAHKGIFTALAILYSYYKPSALLDHLKHFHGRISIGKVCQVCEKNLQWSELAYLLTADKEYDRAARTMISHSADAWAPTEFRDIINQVKNNELLYRAIDFYIKEHPPLLTELLISIKTRVDPARVVNVARRAGHLPLIEAYLKSVQEKNVKAVNEALMELWIEEENFEDLKNAIEEYSEFDALALARKLEKHELIEFRRIASLLYQKNGRWDQAVELSKDDSLYDDAMKAAAFSGNAEVVENLMRFFCENDNPHAFAACLYTCFDFVRPDVVLELAWRYKMTDYIFPYMIQVFRNFSTRVEKLEELAKPVEAPKDDAVPPQVASPVIPNPAMYTNPNPVMMTGGSLGIQPGAMLTNPQALAPGQVPPHMQTAPTTDFYGGFH